MWQHILVSISISRAKFSLIILKLELEFFDVIILYLPHFYCRFISMNLQYEYEFCRTGVLVPSGTNRPVRQNSYNQKTFSLLFIAWLSLQELTRNDSSRLPSGESFACLHPYSLAIKELPMSLFTLVHNKCKFI